MPDDEKSAASAARFTLAKRKLFSIFALTLLLLLILAALPLLNIQQSASLGLAAALLAVAAVAGWFWYTLEYELPATQLQAGEISHKESEPNREAWDQQPEIKQLLLTSNTRLENVLRQSPVAIIEWDLHHRVLEWNHAAEEIFGYSRMQAIGQHANFIVPEDTHEHVREVFRQFSLGNDGKYSVNANLRADGKRIVCHWYNGRILDADGKTSHLLSMVSDITLNRYYEEENRKLAMVVNLSSNIIMIATPEGRLEWVNSAFTAITHYTMEEALGRKPGQLLQGRATDPATVDYMSALIRQGLGFRDVEILNYNKAGQPFWLSLEVQPVLGNDHNVLHFIAVASDITTHKNFETALRFSESKFASAFRCVPDAISITRLSDSHIVDINDTYERIIGYSRAETMGKTSLELGLWPDIDEREQLSTLMRSHQTVNDFPVTTRIKSGELRDCLFSCTSFNVGEEEYYLSIVRDVTEQRAMESEIKNLNISLEERVHERTISLQQANQALASTLTTLNMAKDELVRSDKLAALGSLVAGIAHELNTPIGNSLMIASTLLDHAQDLSKEFTVGLTRSGLAKYIAEVSSASDVLVRNLQKAAGLISSFKQVAVDQTSSQRRKFCLDDVVAEIVLTLSPRINKTNYTIYTNIPRELELDSYPGPLGQVLTNFINNALIHAFEGRPNGQVSISAKVISDQTILLNVYDNGVGIPPENIRRIFDPFFTTKLGAGGSGLGLNIAHNIVTALLGGRVQVQSTLGLGTTFSLTLPKEAPVQADVAA